MFLQWIQFHLERTCYKERKMHVEPIFPLTVAMLQLKEKLALHEGEVGGRIFLL